MINKLKNLFSHLEDYKSIFELNPFYILGNKVFDSDWYREHIE
jgi:hypothetical protein